MAPESDLAPWLLRNARPLELRRHRRAARRAAPPVYVSEVAVTPKCPTSSSCVTRPSHATSTESRMRTGWTFSPFFLRLAVLVPILAQLSGSFGISLKLHS
ncbi:hypothetical protein OG21DRAFT_1501140 [Imleria badia]|nr:hypothetical protein OG21DRAFT_1501140 [Imleria badia]